VPESDDLLVLDSWLNEPIPFVNLSDAKIAELVLPIRYIDLFLGIIRDPRSMREK
jgi:hypothetical protein